MTKAIRILVTGTGGPAAVAFLKSMSGTDVELFAADIDPWAAGLYLVPESNRMLLPRGDAPDFIATLESAVRRHRIDVLVPTVDAELLPVAHARAAFAAMGAQVLLAELSGLETCLDKVRLMEAAREIVPIPATCVLDASTDPRSIVFPSIAKPRRGSGGRGVVLIEDETVLRRLPRDGSLLVQDYLPGEEYSVDVLAQADGTPVVAVPRARMKVDSGIAVTARTFHDEELEALAMRIVSSLRLAFVSNVQFRRDREGRPRLMEINPRLPGTMPLTIAAGVDMPRLALEALRGSRLSGRIGEFRAMGVVRTWTEHFVAPDAFERMAARPASAKVTARGLTRPAHHDA